MSKIIISIVLFAIFLSIPNFAFSHPGNTGRDGCHTCHSNCKKWGEIKGARHCHLRSTAIESLTGKNQAVQDYNNTVTPSSSQFQDAIRGTQVEMGGATLKPAGRGFKLFLPIN